MAIADWVKSKMTVIASAQTVALSDDPVPVFKQLARRVGSLTYTLAMPAKRRNSLNQRAYRRIMTPMIRPWYQQVVNQDSPVVTAPYVDAGSGKLVVTFAVPVKKTEP